MGLVPNAFVCICYLLDGGAYNRTDVIFGTEQTDAPSGIQTIGVGVGWCGGDGGVGGG